MFFITWPASLPQQALEELAVLVEMVDQVVVVGARALHELVEVPRLVLLGLRGRGGGAAEQDQQADESGMQHVRLLREMAGGG